MATYTETKITLDQIAGESDSARRRADNLLAAAVKIQADLADLSTNYAGFVTQLDTDAAASSGDPAWTAAKAEKDRMVSEFVAEKNRVDAMVAALTGL